MKTKFVYLSILLAFSLSGVNAAVPDCQSVVIGSGVAGMKAAMDLKDGGNKVCLIEKMPFPGGATNLAASGVKYENKVCIPFDSSGLFS